MPAHAVRNNISKVDFAGQIVATPNGFPLPRKAGSGIGFARARVTLINSFARFDLVAEARIDEALSIGGFAARVACGGKIDDHPVALLASYFGR